MVAAGRDGWEGGGVAVGHHKGAWQWTGEHLVMPRAGLCLDGCTLSAASCVSVDWAFTGFWFQIHIVDASAIFSAVTCSAVCSSPGGGGAGRRQGSAELAGGFAPAKQ